MTALPAVCEVKTHIFCLINYILYSGLIFIDTYFQTVDSLIQFSLISQVCDYSHVQKHIKSSFTRLVEG